MILKCNLFLCLFFIFVFKAKSEAVTPCPEKCTCTKLEIIHKSKVDCTREKLETIPPASEWPSDIYILDISMNDIKRIDVMETNEELKYLDLATNLIESIEPNAFEHVNKLYGIDLSHNELVTLPETLLDGLADLQTLNLSYNKIKFLPDDFFSKTTYLQELRLAHNPLKILDPELFEHSGQLKVLDLSGIEAFSLKEGLFHMLFELIELDLSDNYLMMVPTNSLRSARKLEILKLSGNPIRIFDEHSFVRLSTLKELYLNNMNELIEIKEKTFSYLYYLRKISINNNPHLSYIDKNAFHGIFNRSWIAIKEADFRANRLLALSEHTLPFCNITTLDLRENPWTCDCHLLWAKHCHLRPELTKGIICANPARFRGTDLSLIDHQNLICEHNEIYREVKMMRLFIIVFASFILFFIGLVFILFIKRDQVVRWWTEKRRGTGAIYYVKAHSNPIEPEI
jgi:Leucine-rich repeat (LRR) protein